MGGKIAGFIFLIGAFVIWTAAAGISPFSSWLPMARENVLFAGICGAVFIVMAFVFWGRGRITP